MTRGTFHALIDADDRVLSGDARFAALNDRAAGRSGAGLALASVAALVRVARGLRVPVARTLTIADEQVDGEWHVRAVPGGEPGSRQTVALAATLVRERPVASAPPGTTAAVAAPPGAGWTWEVDAALRVIAIDAAGAARDGIDPVAVLGRPLAELFVLEAGGNGAMPLLEAMATACDVVDQPAVIRGTDSRVTLNAAVRRDAAGGFDGFVGGTFPGTAPPGPMSDRVAAFNARLHRVLRLPLGTIIAQADSIRAADDGSLAPVYVDYAADIASAGRHLLGLVDDLVDIEAIERADFVTARDRIDLAAVFREASGLLAARSADRGVTIAPVAGSATVFVIGEYRRALQIVVNLLGNAVTYSPEGGVVRPRLEHRDAQVRLTIADEGRGIPADEQSRIFRKFARGDGSEPGGSGLGLYIARRLAEAMGGNLTVASTPGQGAAFTLSLPAASAQPPRQQDQQ